VLNREVLGMVGSGSGLEPGASLMRMRRIVAVLVCSVVKSEGCENRTDGLRMRDFRMECQ
jgi:hypothetical protein